MKRIYWRPRAVSRTALVLIALISLIGLALVERMKVETQRPDYDAKLLAAQRADEAMEVIYYARVEMGPDIDPLADPAQSGMIGIAISPVTSVSGDLVAKQTSVNPNFAAVLVDMLRRAGVEEGQAVAVSCSGSFPALNICTYAAIEALGAKAVVISSASASTWGANVPELLWIDMERRLQEAGIFNIRSIAASLGGDDDMGLGLTEDGKTMLRAAIERNRLPPLEAATFQEAINTRMQLYQQRAGREPIRAFVNIGGGLVAVGKHTGKVLLSPGLNTHSINRPPDVDGVALRFLDEGVPVIHVSQIAQLAHRYGLSVAPTSTPEPGPEPLAEPGVAGNVYVGLDYNRWLVLAVLGMTLGSLYAFIRSDVGFRLLKFGPRRGDAGHPEPMV